MQYSSVVHPAISSHTMIRGHAFAATQRRTWAERGVCLTAARLVLLSPALQPPVVGKALEPQNLDGRHHHVPQRLVLGLWREERVERLKGVRRAMFAV